MKVYGQLEVAQLEVVSSDPSLLPVGRLMFNKTDGYAKIADEGNVLTKFLLNDDQLIIGTSGTLANNVRLNRAGAGILQIVLGTDATAEGSLSTAPAIFSSRQENFATGSLPSAGNAGRIVLDTTTLTPKVDNGSAFKEIALIDVSQIITNKDIDGGVAANTSRITLPGDIKSNLDSLTRKAGTIVYGTDSQKVYFDNGTSLNAVGSGSGGGINYILNPDAEVDTAGWATYADAAGSVPVDGTGGSPNVTFTRSTSSPLRGVASFLFTKDAANRQGQGASYNFTIDNADQARALTISFDYLISSGTYADGDLKLFIYDITNSQLIQPAGSQVVNVNGSNSYKQIATFQTNSNSTSYRFIIHDTTTSALAYTLKFDNFIVGPASSTMGPARIDWMAYTPTFVGFGTCTNVHFFWARDGQDILIRGRVAAGTVTGVIASFSLPAGLQTADSTLIPGIQPSGIWQRSNTGAPAQLQTLLYNANATAINFSFEAPGVDAFVPQVATVLVSANETFSVEDLRIPIAGWSSNVALSNDTDTRVVAMRAYLSSAVATSGGNPIIFNAIDRDSHNGYNTSTGLYTVPVTGWYIVALSSQTNAGSTPVEIFVNGAATLPQSSYLDSSTSPNPHGTQSIYLTAGQTVSIVPDFSVTFNSLSNFNIWRLSGPSVIAASESINVRYTSITGSQSIVTGGSFQNINFETKDYDTHGSVTTGASWRFTAPSSGKYRISFKISYATGSWNASNYAKLRLNKNGSSYADQNYTFTGNLSSDLFYINFNASIRLLAGEYIEPLAAIGRSAGDLNLNNSALSNEIEIERIGNY